MLKLWSTLREVLYLSYACRMIRGRDLEGLFVDGIKIIVSRKRE